jgi:hypothetical protein
LNCATSNSTEKNIESRCHGDGSVEAPPFSGRLVGLNAFFFFFFFFASVAYIWNFRIKFQVEGENRSELYMGLNFLLLPRVKKSLAKALAFVKSRQHHSQQ